SDRGVQAKIGRWARAATGWAEMHSLKLARFGDNMRGVAVTEGDKTEAELRLGVSVNTWGVNDLVEVVDGISDAAVDELVAEYEQTYDVVPELRKGGERHESLRYGARQELGLRSFLDEGGFGAFTTNFEDLGGLKQLPGLAVQRLMADGYGFGAEGDWKTAILVRVAAVMGYGLPGGASLMEDYTYELTPGKEKILGAHMLEVSPSLTTQKPTLEIHPLGIGDREDPVRLKFTADAGPAVVVALSDMRERFRLVANVVDVVEPDQELPNLPVACAVWEPKPDFATSAECWLTAGAAHHTVMSNAVDLETWEDLATIGDLELATIDEGTTARSFAQDLRTNHALHRLAQGSCGAGRDGLPPTASRRALTTSRRAIDEEEPDDDLRAHGLGPGRRGARPQLVRDRRLRARPAARPDHARRAESARDPQPAPARARHPALVRRGRGERRAPGDPRPDAGGSRVRHRSAHRAGRGRRAVRGARPRGRRARPGPAEHGLTPAHLGGWGERDRHPRLGGRPPLPGLHGACDRDGHGGRRPAHALP